MPGIVDGSSVMICDSVICELFSNNNKIFYDRLIERECISFAKTYIKMSARYLETNKSLRVIYCNFIYNKMSKLEIN